MEQVEQLFDQCLVNAATDKHSNARWSLNIHRKARYNEFKVSLHMNEHRYTFRAFQGNAEKFKSIMDVSTHEITTSGAWNLPYAERKLKDAYMLVKTGAIVFPSISDVFRQPPSQLTVGEVRPYSKKQRKRMSQWFSASANMTTHTFVTGKTGHGKRNYLDQLSNNTKTLKEIIIDESFNECGSVFSNKPTIWKTLWKEMEELPSEFYYTNLESLMESRGELQDGRIRLDYQLRSVIANSPEIVVPSSIDDFNLNK